MQNVHPRKVAGLEQESEDATAYDYSNNPFRTGQQREWEPPGPPSLLLHFLGGVTQDTREVGAGSEEISNSARGLMNCIGMLAEARSLRVVSKPITKGAEGLQHARRAGAARAKKRQLYLAPRVRQLIMSAPTQGMLLLSRPDLLQKHVCSERPARTSAKTAYRVLCMLCRAHMWCGRTW